MRIKTFALSGLLAAGLAVPSAMAACLPMNQSTHKACIKYESYEGISSTQGAKHVHYFINSCRRKIQITFEWANAVPRKWNHVTLPRGRRGVSCLNGACPGPLIWSPVCRDGAVGRSTLARIKVKGKPAVHRRVAIAKPAARLPLDSKVIGIWDFKNRHDCPRHTMRCVGRYEYRGKKRSHEYVFGAVVSCRRDVKPGVKARPVGDTTFTTYFDEIWSIKGNRITATSQVKPGNKNVSALTLSSYLRNNRFSGTGPSCNGKGTQEWTAIKRG